MKRVIALAGGLHVDPWIQLPPATKASRTRALAGPQSLGADSCGALPLDVSVTAAVSSFLRILVRGLSAICWFRRCWCR